MSFKTKGEEYIKTTEDDWLAVEQYMFEKWNNWAALFLMANIPYGRGYSAYERARSYGTSKVRLSDWTALADVRVQYPL